MTDNNSNPSSIKKLDALSSEVFDLDSIPSAEEARSSNIAKGIDTNELQKWALERLNRSIAMTILSKAKEKRQQQNSVLERIKIQANSTYDELKTRVRDKLAQLGPSERTTIYCREFEEASEADLLEMLKDILALENILEEDSKDEL